MPPRAQSVSGREEEEEEEEEGSMACLQTGRAVGRSGASLDMCFWRSGDIARRRRMSNLGS